MNYVAPPTSIASSLPSWNSASFWASVAGIASIVCGALKLDPSWTQWIQATFVAVGGILIGIPTHHVVKAQVAAKSGVSSTKA